MVFLPNRLVEVAAVERRVAPQQQPHRRDVPRHAHHRPRSRPAAAAPLLHQLRRRGLELRPPLKNSGSEKRIRTVSTREWE